MESRVKMFEISVVYINYFPRLISQISHKNNWNTINKNDTRIQGITIEYKYALGHSHGGDCCFIYHN